MTENRRQFPFQDHLHFHRIVVFDRLHAEMSRNYATILEYITLYC